MFLVCILVRCALLCLIFWMHIWMFHAHFIHACGFSSVFGSLKGSCRAEREEKITGADIICFCHVGLASWLTQCGPVRHGCQVDVPAHILRHNACTYPTHWPTPIHTRGCAGMTCMHAEPHMQTQKKKSHTYVFSHPHWMSTVSFLLKENTYRDRTGRFYIFPTSSFPRQKIDGLLKTGIQNKGFYQL